VDRDVPADVVEDLVGDPRRRVLLRHLAERDDPIALTDLAAAVRADETGRPRDQVSASDCQAVREDILQHHLPKLTAVDAVEYDSMRGTLSLRPGPVADRVV
jgi:hypothetical protein